MKINTIIAPTSKPGFNYAMLTLKADELIISYVGSAGKPEHERISLHENPEIRDIVDTDGKWDMAGVDALVNGFEIVAPPMLLLKGFGFIPMYEVGS